LESLGFLTDKDLNNFKANSEKTLPPEPNPTTIPFAGPATGPLGGGLAFSAGAHLASQVTDSKPPKTLLILGDGEFQKGQVLEALGYTAKINYKNLTAVVDCNGLQLDGKTSSVTRMSIEKIFNANGWDTQRVDGHNILDLHAAFSWATSSRRPAALLAKTVKGKGIPEMENNPAWHYFTGENSESLIRCISKESQLKIQRLESEKKIDYNHNPATRILSARSLVTKVLRERIQMNSKLVCLSADLLAGSGLGDLRNIKGINKNQIHRLPLAENLLFRAAEGLIYEKCYPILGIFESLLSIVMLELQALVQACEYNKGGVLIIAAKPGRCSDDGPSMRSISVPLMLESIPGLTLLDPRDGVELSSMLTTLTTKNSGLAVLRTPDNIAEEIEQPSDLKLPSTHLGAENIGIIVASGWTFEVCCRFLANKGLDKYVDIIGISNTKMMLDPLFVNVLKRNSGKIIGCISDTGQDWIANNLAKTICRNKIRFSDFIPLGACGVLASQKCSNEEYICKEVTLFMHKIKSKSTNLRLM